MNHRPSKVLPRSHGRWVIQGILLLIKAPGPTSLLVGGVAVISMLLQLLPDGTDSVSIAANLLAIPVLCLGGMVAAGAATLIAREVDHGRPISQGLSHWAYVVNARRLFETVIRFLIADQVLVTVIYLLTKVHPLPGMPSTNVAFALVLGAINWGTHKNGLFGANHRAAAFGLAIIDGVSRSEAEEAGRAAFELNREHTRKSGFAVVAAFSLALFLSPLLFEPLRALVDALLICVAGAASYAAYRNIYWGGLAMVGDGGREAA